MGRRIFLPLAWRLRCTSIFSIPNFGIQEYMHHSSTTDEVFPHGYSYHAGYMHPGDAPGLGVDIDEKLAAKFPYQRAYLPVNRKMDGTLV